MLEPVPGFGVGVVVELPAQTIRGCAGRFGTLGHGDRSLDGKTNDACLDEAIVGCGRSRHPNDVARFVIDDEGCFPLQCRWHLPDARVLRGRVDPERLVSGHENNSVVEVSDPGESLHGLRRKLGCDQGDARLDSGNLEHRDEQRRLILAITELPLEYGLGSRWNDA